MAFPTTPTYEVDPISRIEGHLGIAVTTTGSGSGMTVTEAYAHGNLWRGFENFLLGRDINDAITFVQRICGVCPVPHGMTSTYAVDSVLGYSKGHITFPVGVAPSDGFGVPAKATVIRNLVLGCEFLMSSITHFYHLAAPSYVQGPNMAPWTPYFANGYYHAALRSAGHGVGGGGVAPLVQKPTAASTAKFAADIWSAVILSYVRALRVRRLTFEAGALFAGRMPMTSCFIGGGVTFDGTESLTPRITKFKAIMTEVALFVLQEYIPIVLALKYLYPDCDNQDNGGYEVVSGDTHKGAGGGLGRFLAWGAFPRLDGSLDIAGGVYDGSVTFTAATKQQVYDQFISATSNNAVAKNLTEDIEWSRYDKASQDTSAYGKNGLGASIASTTAAYPGAISRTKPKRSAGYSYMKAPRWNGKSMEVGPFARLVVNGIYKIDGTLLQNMGGFLGAALSTSLYLKTVGAATGLDPKLVGADIAVSLFLSGLATLVYNGTSYSIDGSAIGGLTADQATTALPNVDVAAVYGHASTVIQGPIVAQVLSIAGGLSTLDRIRGRALESAYIVTQMLGLYNKATGTFLGGWDGAGFTKSTWVADLQSLTGSTSLDIVGSTWRQLPIPPGTKQGWGATEAPRGALMHQATIVGGKITKYQCIVPTTWNGSPRTTTGTTYRGAIEESCIGSHFNEQGDTTFAGQTGSVVAQSGVEILRHAQSFDPCIACAIH